MTIKVTVTNSDPRETAIISVGEWGTANKEFVADTPPVEHKKLKGGESAEVWVHSGQYLIVKEVSQ
jgi:hypothetical protein